MLPPPSSARPSGCVLVSNDFEEILESTLKVSRVATIRTRRALADALARGYAESGAAPEAEDE
ncbi:MAG: hypothetical protein ABIQ16_00650 [Polyangiaceae bacterium]